VCSSDLDLLSSMPGRGRFVATRLVEPSWIERVATERLWTLRDVKDKEVR
jgi:hypothetical protein